MLGRSLAVAVVLVVIGLGSYIGSGAASPTALIPAIFGAAIGATALAARRSSRPVAWDIATLALAALCALGCTRGLIALPDLLRGAIPDRSLSVAAQSATGLVCIAFLAVSLVALRWRSGRTTVSP